MLFKKWTHWLGLPFPGSPLGYSFPCVLSSIEWTHIPVLRGGAPVGWTSVVGSKTRQRGGGGCEGRNEPTSTIDTVDVGFKLRSHSQ